MKIDMETYNDSTQAWGPEKGESISMQKSGFKGIIILIAVNVTLVGALRILIVKPTNTNTANQTNNDLHKIVHIPICLSIALTTKE